jgi:hypothetical protein
VTWRWREGVKVVFPKRPHAKHGVYPALTA